MSLQTRLNALVVRIAQEFKKREPSLRMTEHGLTFVPVDGAPTGTVEITFNKTYAKTPYVMHAKHSSGLAKFITYVGVTTTGMTLGVYSGDGTNGNGQVPVFWAVFSDE